MTTLASGLVKVPVVLTTVATLPPEIARLAQKPIELSVSPGDRVRFHSNAGLTVTVPVELLKTRRHPSSLLVDQGTRDKFLDEQLKPELLAAACEANGQPLALRMREGYDHSYFFVSTFMDEHLAHHARLLGASG